MRCRLQHAATEAVLERPWLPAIAAPVWLKSAQFVPACNAYQSPRTFGASQIWPTSFKTSCHMNQGTCPRFAHCACVFSGPIASVESKRNDDAFLRWQMADARNAASVIYLAALEVLFLFSSSPLLGLSSGELSGPEF